MVEWLELGDDFILTCVTMEKMGMRWRTLKIIKIFLQNFVERHTMLSFMVRYYYKSCKKYDIVENIKVGSF